MDLKAVIFDMDGVLADTVEHHYRSWKQIADRLGIPFSRLDNDKLRGLSRQKSLEVLLGEREVSKNEQRDLLEEKKSYFLEHVEEMSPQDLLPGVAELFLELWKAGIPIGVSSSSENVRIVLEKLEIDGYVAAVADRFSVQAPKPHPDVFLHTAALLDVLPQQCLVIEDSEAGIQAALAAGMCVVGVGPADVSRAAHAIFPGLGNVTLAHLHEVYSLWCR